MNLTKEVIRVKWIKSLIVGSVIGLSKLAYKFADVKVYNKEIWLKNVFNRKPGTPVITAQNHISVMDDPSLWATLIPFRDMFKWNKIRYSLGAQEIMFFNPFAVWFFGAAGKVLPTVRGAGIHQYAIRQAIRHLRNGEWVNIFPEGKVNQSGTVITMKWGIGRLVSEVKPTPAVVPIYHTGLEKVLPEGQPYIPRIFPRKQIRVYVGEPIHFEDLVEKHAKTNLSPSHLYVDITKRVYEEMLALENKVKAGAFT